MRQVLGREGGNCVPESRAACRRAGAAGRRVLAAIYMAYFANLCLVSEAFKMARARSLCLQTPETYVSYQAQL